MDVQQLPQTLDQVKQYLFDKFNADGTQKRINLIKFAKNWLNMDIKLKRQSTFQSLINEIYEYIKVNRLLPSTMQIDIRETIEKGLENIREETKQELKDNQFVKNENLQYMDKQEVQLEDRVEMKIDDENFYVPVDLRNFTEDANDICILNQDQLIEVFDKLLKPTFIGIIDKVNSQGKLGLSIGVMNRYGQIIRTNIIHPNNYQDPEEVAELLLAKINDNFDKYEKDADDNYYTYLGQDFRYLLVWYTTKIQENQQIIGSIWQPIDLQNQKYLFVDTDSKTNCVFNSIYISYQWIQFWKQPQQQKKQWIINILTNQEQRKMLAKKFKERAGFNDEYSRTLISELDIQYITDKLKLNYILYDNQLQKINKIQNNEQYDWIKIMIYQGTHAIPMISMKQLKQIYDQDELNIIINKNKPELIKQLHNYQNSRKQQIQINQQQVNYHQQLIRSPKIKEMGKIEDIIVSWDLETYTFNQRPYIYLSGLLFSDKNGNRQFKQFKGDFINGKPNLQVFWEYIINNIDLFDKKIFYAHCGGRFDINLLIRDVLNRDQNSYICQKSTIEINGKWISFGVNIKRQNQKPAFIEFRDSYNLMPLSLKKVTQSFCNQYIKTDLDHNKINMIIDKIGEPNIEKYMNKDYQQNYNEQEQILQVKLKEFMNLAEPYHKIDCQSLFEALCNLDIMFRNELYLSILCAKTISGLAKKFYLTQYYKYEKYTIKQISKKTGKNIEKEKYKYIFPIFKLTYEQDLFMRKSYKGGMNMCNYYGIVKNQKLYYYDFNSHYPNCGRKDLPYGFPIPINFQNVGIHKCNQTSQYLAEYSFNLQKYKCGCYKGVDPLTMNQFTMRQAGIFDVIIAGTDQQLKYKIPYVSVKDKKNNNILCYPYIKQARIETLTKPEIMYANYQGYQILVLKGYKFQQESILKEMFENLYKFKANAKAQKDSCKELMFKLMINSGYGWLGLNTYKSSKIIFTSKQSKEYLDYMENGILQSITQWPNNKVLRVGGSFNKYAECNVAIASYITAYARIELHKVATAIQKKGYHIYYMDTDSLVTTCNLSDPNNQDLIKLTRPDDYYCTKLGSLKNERGMDLNQKDLYFTDAIFIGCKNYGLKDQDFINIFKQSILSVLHLTNNQLEIIDEDEFIVTNILTQDQKQQILQQYKSFNGFDIEIKDTLCYSFRYSNLEVIKNKLYQNYIYISSYDYDVDEKTGINNKIIRFETNELIPQKLMDELQIYQVHKYTYHSDKYKYIFKKLKGFSQNISDKKLKYSLYEDMCKVYLNEKTQKYEHQMVYQETNRINIPKYTFVRDINSIQGENYESFQMKVENNIKKQFKMIPDTKGSLDKDGFLIPKTI